MDDYVINQWYRVSDPYDRGMYEGTGRFVGWVNTPNGRAGGNQFALFMTNHDEPFVMHPSGDAEATLHPEPLLGTP